MKVNFSKKISAAFAGLIAAASPLSLTNLTSCSDNSIQLANFESYMDDDLMEYLNSKYGVHYQWFTVDEMIETKFQRFYDICVPSGYELVSLYKKGWLEKLDWSKFQLDGITTKEQAKGLFRTNLIDGMNAQLQAYLQDSTFDVLDYGVPYFAQQFMFGYRGSKIDFYSAKTGEKTDKPTWEDIYYTISPANPYVDDRFVPGKGSNLCSMLDDAKSLFDIARIMETYDDSKSPAEQPATNDFPADMTISQMENTLNKITDKFANKPGKWFSLNTDSGIISRNLASTSHPNPCAFAWSGDMLYAALGAEEFPCLSGEEFHIQKPYGASLDEIEFLVINKKNHSDQTRLDKIYEIVKTVCLDGATVSKDEIGIPETEQKNRDYHYWTMQNWDCVNYTPMLNNIYDYVQDSDLYWSDYLEKIPAQDQEATLDLYRSILQETNPDYAKSIFGRTLTPLQNSNTHWAWLAAKPKL